jgi:hypothetical protein
LRIEDSLALINPQSEIHNPQSAAGGSDFPAENFCHELRVRGVSSLEKDEGRTL